MKTVLPSREEARRDIFRTELGSKRRSNAAKLRPIELERIGCLTHYLKGRLQMEGLRHG